MMLLQTCAICYLMLCALFCQEAYSQACNSGFINRDVLERRATKIDSYAPGVSSTFLSPGQFLVMPGWNFSCSGNITSFLVGVEVRDLLGNPAVIDLWRPTYGMCGILAGYRRVPGAQTYLNFSRGDFTPDGVYQYHILGSGIQYQSGDIFGVYQSSNPDSPVHIFYTDQLAAPRTFDVNTSYAETYKIQPSGYDLFTAGTVLVHPISDNEHCLHGFPSENQLREQILQVNINGVVSRPRTQLIFPDIRFTCHGFITKWIVGAQARSTGNWTEMPELQIWQAHRGTNTYNKTAYSLIMPNETSNPHVHEYIPVPPLEVNIGDILGVYQPQVNLSKLVLYNQKWSGPANYAGDGNALLNVIMAEDCGDGYDYPLVAVEVKAISSTDPSTDPSTDRSTPSTDRSTPLTLEFELVFTHVVIIIYIIMIVMNIVGILSLLIILYMRRKKHGKVDACPTRTKPIQKTENKKVQDLESAYN